VAKFLMNILSTY